MMMKLICIVNGIRLQKPSPKAWAVLQGEAPSATAATATIDDGERREHVGVRNPPFRPGATT